MFPAGKYWTSGRPEDSPLQGSQDVPYLTVQGRPDLTSWGRPEMTSRGRPNMTFKDVPGRLIRDVPRTFSGRPLEDVQNNQTWMSQLFLNFLSD